MKKITLIVLIFLFSWPLIAGTPEKSGNSTVKRYTLSGSISDKNNGEQLIGATLFIKELKTGTTSNVYGFYSISLEPGEYTFTWAFLGYESIEKKIKLTANTTQNIELVSKSQKLSEVEIRAQRANENVAKNEMSTVKLSSKTIKEIPALMGEVDIIKALQLLPGVQATSEGATGFSVRGGAPDQNLILLDEATVYNASHFLGFFSVFNNDAIKDVTIYKGDIPVQFGGRLSSVVDVRMNDGNNKKFAATGGIGTISSRLTVEGPLVKNQTSFILSGRRTYFDLFLPLSSDENVRDNQVYFYDFNAKISHKINENNRIFLSGYFGRDVFNNDFFRMNLGNQTFTMRWNHLFSKKLFTNFTFIQSKYDYQLGTTPGQANSFTWKSQLQDYGLKADFNYFITPENNLKFGVSSIYHVYHPGRAAGDGDNSLFTEFIVPSNYALEHSIYAGNDQKINNKFSLKYGIRATLFQNIGSATIYNYNANFESIDSTVYKKGDIFNHYFRIEPRFGAAYMFNDKFSIKANYSRTYQFIQLAQNSTSGTPLDVWFPTSPNIEPQSADQFSLGFFRNFLGNTFEASIEGYYKLMNNTIDFKDHAQLLLNEKLEGEVRIGEAKAYGVEFLLKKPDGKLNGWISYTISRSERTIPGINDGRTYLAPFDKTHNASVVLNYRISNRTTLSANWVYYTGNPVTFPTGRANIGGVIAPIYSDRNSYRMPDYHRLDVSLTLKSKEKPNRKWSHEWVFSVYNLYNRHNAWSIQFSKDEDKPNTTYAEKVYLFGFLPAVTFNFKF
jgi:outer membrane cobalamin receptor